MPRLLPRAIQLCAHCQQRPAGFWHRRTSGQTVRRPWCLSCCQGLDRDRYDVIAFGG
jgi:protein-arginine kinase activator protein McsA